MNFEPIKKVNSYELIVEQIEARIRDGELSAGDRLPGERRLMETFSVSRSTVREAMRVLHATGVVEPHAGDPRGSEVIPFSPKTLQRPLARMAHQEGTSRAELIQFRLLLEGQSALLAAALCSDETKDEIESRAADLAELAASDSADAVEEFGRVLSAFHHAIRLASSNQLLQATGQAVDGALTEIARQRLDDETHGLARRGRLGQSAQDAAGLAERIRDGDAAGARRTATENIYRFYRDSLTEAERATLEPLVG
ncbi:FadR family transcriptional regulator [Nesterenkonia salmonea]|uniref:FadR family transcriptional regulator n=1 Tax=Nesterenkonia salmonea TaxID=1804987 RepID=A0A5R9BKR3_9MICC|nr:GntR family transcriptional regulator [Nesterenkonia salmonea]TLQ01105.1 FadR family transcriptional regulator [Nesterenkonia salmonea]